MKCARHGLLRYDQRLGEQHTRPPRPVGTTAARGVARDHERALNRAKVGPP